MSSQIPINVVIVGATGAVGLELMKLLDGNTYFHFTSLKLLASKSSAGTTCVVNNNSYIVEELCETSFDNVHNLEGLNIAIFSIDSSLSELYAPFAVKNSYVVIDNSSAFRMRSDVPLVIPEVNPEKLFQNNGIISNPNCSTIIMLTVLYNFYKKNKIKKINVSTFQAVSGAGIRAQNELKSQAYSFVNNTSPDITVFGRECLFNCFSHDSEIDLKSGFNGEEIKMINETRKILNDPSILINPTCIRVPTLRSHLESIQIEFEKDTSVEELYGQLEKAPGVEICNDPKNNRFPEPLLSANKNDILVGRIRNQYQSQSQSQSQSHNDDYIDKKNFMLLLSGDQLLKGAALNAIQIAQILICNYSKNEKCHKKQKII